MKATVESVHIKNFKAFQDTQPFELDNKNVLVFGNNGSGKSSLFWALYTFLQSSIKDASGTQKYFRVFDPLDKDTHQSLRNVFMDDGEDSYIEVVIKEDNGNKKTYKIEEGNIPTIPGNNGGDTNIQLLNLASDFINYKLLHNFYRGSHRIEINIWPVFERDIFPFLVDNAGNNLFDRLKTLTKDVPRNAGRASVPKNSGAGISYIQKIDDLNNELTTLLAQIQQNANEFLKEHFFDNQDRIELAIDYREKLSFEKSKKRLWRKGFESERERNYQIFLAIKVKDHNSDSWINVARPHSFLHESQLTRIAIAIRIGAMRTRVQTTEFKILVLDDMLISLDMSNRMKVIKMILGQQEGLTFFDDFQKIILTHDRGFYELIKRHTTTEHWKYFNFDKDESNNNPPTISEDFDWLEKAKMYLAEGKPDEAGLAIRKETENLVVKALKGLNDAANEGNYEPLNNQLNELRNKLKSDDLTRFNRLVNKDIGIDDVRKLTTDFENDGSLDANTKGRLRGLKNETLNFLIRQYEQKENHEQLLGDIQDLLKRVMNPSAHASLTTLYPGELQEAIDTVTELKAFLER